MKTEYNSLVENNVWELVDNEEIKPISSCWHFALNCGPSGEIVRYKARLVAKGYCQVPVRDYIGPIHRQRASQLSGHFPAMHSVTVLRSKNWTLKLHTLMLTLIK